MIRFAYSKLEKYSDRIDNPTAQNSSSRDTKVAEYEGISASQFVTLAAAEKVSMLRTLHFLKVEVAKGNREDFEAFLAGVPDVEPDPEDRLQQLTSFAFPAPNVDNA